VLGASLTSGAYNWTQTVGPWIERPGHPDFWGYTAEDLVGFYEYLQLMEDIGTDALWVVNAATTNSSVAWMGARSGVTANGTMPRVQRAIPSELSLGGVGVSDDVLQAWTDLAVNSLHFALADPSTNYYASLRAAMGHPAPFSGLKYMAIG